MDSEKIKIKRLKPFMLLLVLIDTGSVFTSHTSVLPPQSTVKLANMKHPSSVRRRAEAPSWPDPP
ncbi:MAG: hypothetical protein ACFE98_17410 [Candidatus Hermodarchaeota archaeon]